MITTPKNHLVIFMKYPEPGEVKTRLGKDITMAHAARIYDCFLKDLLHHLAPLPYQTHLAYFPASAKEKIRQRYHGDHHLRLQKGQTLGDKLYHCFTTLFNQHAENVVIIGSDIPELSTSQIDRSFSTLSSGKAVLGPCTDGGYYLLGLTKPMLCRSLFDTISWSTEHVLTQTIKKLSTLSIPYSCLKILSDIDDLTDLNALYQRIETETVRYPHLVPVLNSLFLNHTPS